MILVKNSGKLFNLIDFLIRFAGFQPEISPEDEPVEMRKGYQFIWIPSSFCIVQKLI